MSQPQVVRYKTSKGVDWEVLCKPGAAQKFRDKKLGFGNVMFADDIFVGHYQKGERAKPADIAAEFPGGLEKALEHIVLTGSIALSQKERDEKVRQKRLEIVNLIHKYYVDPKTNSPHPVTRIENALDTLKVHPDPDTPADRQLPDILKKMPGVLALRKCEMEATLSIPTQYAGAAAGIVRRFATVHRERYTGTAATLDVSFAPGEYDALVAELTKVTKGDFQIDAVAGGGASPAPAVAAGKGGAKGGAKGGKGMKPGAHPSKHPKQGK